MKVPIYTIIHVGDTYADLGATITGPQADLNLGIHLFLNGSPVDAIQLDSAQAATDTIDYVATDQNGLTSTSTRTVIIDAAPSAAPADDASTTMTTTNCRYDSFDHCRAPPLLGAQMPTLARAAGVAAFDPTATTTSTRTVIVRAS